MSYQVERFCRINKLWEVITIACSFVFVRFCFLFFFLDVKCSESCENSAVQDLFLLLLLLILLVLLFYYYYIISVVIIIIIIIINCIMI